MCSDAAPVATYSRVTVDSIRAIVARVEARMPRQAAQLSLWRVSRISLGEGCSRISVSRIFACIYEPEKRCEEFKGCKWPFRARGKKGSGEHRNANIGLG